MKTYIILLRAVMPTGKNKVPMAQLREILARDGFGNVRTYIQSGNVLVDTDLPLKRVGSRVHELIQKNIGPDLTVVARTSAELRKVLAGNPFQQGHEVSRVFFVLFAQNPAPEKVEELLAEDFGAEKLVITEDAAYMYIPGTYGRGKLSSNFLEKKLDVAATMRNFNTMNKLVEISNN
jgi:uncharacterized protein (DUF1697 family)